MNVSYQWLSDYIDLGGITPEELAEKLTRGGIEVGSIQYRNQGVSNVVVGLVKTRIKHPNADKLSVCTVDAGQGEDLQIVCGAPNVAAGQKVPVALPGATLPGGVKIKRAKLRDVESQGMICSARELGLNDKLLPKELQEGILVLPEDVPIGADIREVLALDDAVLELELTPNRADCLSMLGVAYEVAALTGRAVRVPDADVERHLSADQIAGKIEVGIQAPDLCSHYSVRYIKGVKIGPSPVWLQNRLMAAGIRPINNIVDVTNYVMLEYGQPLHAFDAAKVAGGRIEVRLAREGETLETLDGQLRKLEPYMLVIADAEKAIGLAGVMGGANSEVTPETTDIILESAKFDGGTIRKTSRELGLRSEASLRFEKEVDPGRVIAALDRAAALMARLGGGSIADGIAEAVVAKPEPKVVDLRLTKVNAVLGTELSAQEVQSILNRLDFPYKAVRDDRWRVIVPTRRGDISLEEDLIEEIARLYGYDLIPTTPITGPTTPGSLTRPQAIRREIRRTLTHAGLCEAISYSLTSAENARFFPALSEGARPIPVAMPMSEERSVLRTALIPSLLEAAAYNMSRRSHDVALFEIGSVYHSEEPVLTRLPREKHRLAIGLAGAIEEGSWNKAARPADFYDLKGLLETVLARLGLENDVRFEAAQPEGFHPGRTAALKLKTPRGYEVIGYAGQLHPDLQRKFELPDTYVAEIDLDPVYEQSDPKIEYRPLPRYPSVERDLAVVVDQSVTGAALVDAVRETGGELLETVAIFDVYTGEKIGPGKKSVALSMVYRHAERTLTDEEVNAAQDRILTRLEQSFGAELRK